MLSKKDLSELARYLDEAFPDKGDAERKEMLDILAKDPVAQIPFVTIVDGHYTKVGVKTEKGDCPSHSIYFETEHYNELYD